jgi:hypothetical protein
MPEPGSLLAAAAFLVLVGVMLAFAFGTQRNIRLGNERLRWLQGGLPLLGKRATMRWLGSSAVQLDIVEPLDPFREATVLVVLEPRDVPLLWLFARARGRRDVVIVRGNLRRAPRFDLDATDPAAWLPATDTDEAGWQPTAFADGVEAKLNGEFDPVALDAARRTWQEIAAAGGTPWRLSVRRTVPHLEIHVRPGAPTTGSAERLIAPVLELGRELSRV